MHQPRDDLSIAKPIEDQPEKKGNDNVQVNITSPMVERNSDLDSVLMPPPPMMSSMSSSKPKAPPQKDVFPMLGGPQRVNSSAVGVPRSKKPLAPGHSPLDWANLMRSNIDFAGVSQIERYTVEDVKKHCRKDDLWMAYNGKVYNVTKYLNYHPGGVGQLMRGAGKDATDLINKIHPWVNIDMILGKCFVGYLMRDNLNI